MIDERILAKLYQGRNEKLMADIKNILTDSDDNFILVSKLNTAGPYNPFRTYSPGLRNGTPYDFHLTKVMLCSNHTSQFSFQLYYGPSYFTSRQFLIFTCHTRRSDNAQPHFREYGRIGIPIVMADHFIIDNPAECTLIIQGRSRRDWFGYVDSP